MKVTGSKTINYDELFWWHVLLARASVSILDKSFNFAEKFVGVVNLKLFDKSCMEKRIKGKCGQWIFYMYHSPSVIDINRSFGCNIKFVLVQRAERRVPLFIVMTQVRRPEFEDFFLQINIRIPVLNI